MKSLLLLILAVGVLCISPNVFAANSGQADIPFVVTLINPCNGEAVDVNGVVHADATITITGKTIHMTAHFNPQGLTGVGETTGATYHGTGVTRMDQEASVVNGSFTSTFINRFDFIGHGSVPNFSVHETAHITLNEDGTMTVSFDKLSTTCH